MVPPFLFFCTGKHAIAFVSFFPHDFLSKAVVYYVFFVFINLAWVLGAYTDSVEES